MIVAVGDIHGRNDLLQALLAEIRQKVAGPYTLLFLGDLSDRGPDSFLVVAAVKALVEARQAICLKGNHEDFMMDYLRNPWKDHAWLYPNNGGLATIKSYTETMRMYGRGNFEDAIRRSGHYDWIKNLPYFYETEDLWFSHAPVPKRQWRRFDDPRVDVEALTWTFHGNVGGQTEESFAQDHGKLAVCGHIHALMEGNLKPRVYRHIVYLDTGAGCWVGAPLSAAVLEGGRLLEILQTYPAGVKAA